MLSNETLDVYSSIEVLYWILRLFGYAPYGLRIKQGANVSDHRNVPAGWRTKFYTTAFLLAYTLAYAKFMFELKHTGFTSSIIEGKGEHQPLETDL
uniref:Uncharacterized protein n=1 Tax=Anopheles stephensi TaxID=30069 RepID=A0A182YN99_ANOST